MAFSLGAVMGTLIGQKEARGCRFMDQIDDGDDGDDFPAMDFLMNESKRLN